MTDYLDQIMESGQRVAAACADWQPGLDEQRKRELDGDLSRSSTVLEGLEKIVALGVEGLVRDRGEQYALHVIGQVLSTKIAPGCLSLSVFALCKVSLAREWLTTPGLVREEAVREADKALEEIQVFARGDAPEGYKLIDELKAFAREHVKKEVS